MPAGDVFGLDGFFLNKSNPVTVSFVDINTASSSAGIAITGGSFSAGTVTLNLSNAAGLTTTPFYTGAIVGVSSISQAGIAHTGYNGTFVVTGFAGTTTVSYATTGYVGAVTASIGATTIGYIQLLTDTQVTNTTWSSAQTHGWFGGGIPGPVSTVNRINFSNDTGIANIRGSLSLSRGYLAATGNSNYGWFGGGVLVPATKVSTVDRIDFSNDSTTASFRGPLSSARYALAATGNSNYGWFGGDSSPGASIVDRIDFSNDSSTTLRRGSLNGLTDYSAATGNSNYGWFGGGLIISTVNRIDFSSDSTTASVRGPLSLSRYASGATGNSNYGWFGGGLNPGIIGGASLVDRIDFSNDSVIASLRGPLTSGRGYAAATGNSNYGWWGGGSPTTSRVDRIDFSNDSSTASPRGPLSLARYFSAATSGQARSSSVRLQKAGNYGWFGGSTSPTFSVVVDRIDFSNDSSTALARGSLTAGRGYFAATGNSNYGWFGGGRIAVPTPVSTVERIDFSNDSTTASVRGPLTIQRAVTAAVSNPNYGWFAGGLNPGSVPTNVSRMDRINFSNDSATTTIRSSNSPEVLVNTAAVGNSNYGWFSRGPTNRLDFSNDNVSLLPRGSLPLIRTELAATGNSNYGWFGGGTFPSIIASRVDRIDFSNDSAEALIRGQLTQARTQLAATGNSNYGWFGGGRTPTIVATVDRIDFSNDSATASPRGPLSSTRTQLAATSNSTR
jgi:hypothetical protein